MNSLPFVKMEGAGNDYVYVDGGSGQSLDWPALAVRLSDRHFGIGSDGLILILPPTRAGSDARMRMFNADGSEGLTCGNGLRCVAKWLFDRGRASASMRIETAAGPVDARIVEVDAQDRAAQVAVTMGVPEVHAPFDCETPTGVIVATPVDLGNPHAVVFVDDVESHALERTGRALQSHPRFPDSVNVEIVQVTANRDVVQRTFERGSGETLACGSGAVAAAATAMLRRGTFGECLVQLRGGVVRVRWPGPGRTAELVGPAREVFRGEVDL